MGCEEIESINPMVHQLYRSADLPGRGTAAPRQISHRHRFWLMLLLHEASVVTVLVVLTVLVGCVEMAALIHWAGLQFTPSLHRLGPWRSGTLIARFTIFIIVLHGLQILLWASYYHWKFFSSWESALYFSIANYTTVGAGDLLLPGTWRILGAVESGIGILMCGLSIAFIFAAITRLIEREARSSPELAWMTDLSERERR